MIERRWLCLMDVWVPHLLVHLVVECVGVLVGAVHGGQLGVHEARHHHHHVRHSAQPRLGYLGHLQG